MNNDSALWGLVLAFIGWEFFAHFVAHNHHEHTLSNRIGRLEAQHPKAKALVVLACFTLMIHLIREARPDHQT